MGTESRMRRPVFSWSSSHSHFPGVLEGVVYQGFWAQNKSGGVLWREELLELPILQLLRDGSPGQSKRGGGVKWA